MAIVIEREGGTVRVRTGFQPRRTVAGIVLLAFGAVLSALVLALGLVNDDGTPASIWWGLGPGLPIMLLGGCVASGRAGVEVTRGSRELTCWWGLLVGPRFRMRNDLTTATELQITREVRGARTVGKSGGRRIVYPVDAVLADGTRSEVLALHALEDAWCTAEAVARALALRIVNRVGREPSIREARELDMSLGERLRASGAPPVEPVAPRGGRIAVERRGAGDFRAVLPRMGPLRAGLGGVLLFLPFLGLGLSLLVGEGERATFHVPFAVVTSLPVVWFSLRTIHRMAVRETLEIGRGRIAVHRGRPWWTRTRALAVDALAEVTVTELRPCQVHLIAGERMLSLGRSLDPPERQHLADLVRYAVCV